jgi:hypothetical protein
MSAPAGQEIRQYKYSVLWPRAWQEFLYRLQLAGELYGAIIVRRTEKEDVLQVECEVADDRILLDACVCLNRPPAF